MNNYILVHHGVRGQKWGVRRYQNPDGSLTARGKLRLRPYGEDIEKINKFYNATKKADYKYYKHLQNTLGKADKDAMKKKIMKHIKDTYGIVPEEIPIHYKDPPKPSKLSTVNPNNKEQMYDFEARVGSWTSKALYDCIGKKGEDLWWDWSGNAAELGWSSSALCKKIENDKKIDTKLKKLGMKKTRDLVDKVKNKKSFNNLYKGDDYFQNYAKEMTNSITVDEWNKYIKG